MFCLGLVYLSYLKLPWYGMYMHGQAHNSASKQGRVMHLSGKIFVFVDGNNTYHLLRRFFPSGVKLTGFDYRRLIQKVLETDMPLACFYYIGRVRPTDKRSLQFQRAQQRLFSHLSSSRQGFVIRTAQLKFSEGRFQEKGVDVLLAIDLVIKAIRNEYDTAVLLSSDADFAPAMSFVRSLGKRVVYLSFQDIRSHALSKHASKTLVITRDMVQACLVQ